MTIEEIVAVEQRRPVRETPAERLIRETADFSVALARLAGLTLILASTLLAAFLTLDLAVFRFDQAFDVEAQKPSNWLSIGGLVMTGALLLVILFSRRFGGEEASRAVTAAWGVGAVGVLAELTHLAPILQDADFPSARFVVVFVASAMIGQYFAASVYDVVRGGGPWWRAPLLAALVGFALQVVIYYPALFWSSGAPFAFWMIADFAVKCLAAFAFLPIYRMLMKPLRPKGGYGGKRA